MNKPKPKRIPITDSKSGEVRYSEPVNQSGPRKSMPEQTAPGNAIAAESSAPGKPVPLDLPAVEVQQGNEPIDKTPAASTPAKPKVEIETFGQFIGYAYSRKGHKVSLKAKVERTIAQAPTLTADDMERIGTLVKEDAVLAVPRQLLLAARFVEGFPALKSAIRSFVRDVMLRHPIFQQPGVEAAVRNLEDAPRPEEVLRRIGDFDKKLLLTQESDDLKAPEFEQLRLNAVNCMAIWLADVKSLSVHAVADALFLALWRPRAMALEHDASKLRALTEMDELAGVGLVCDEFRRQAIDKHAQADSAVREATAQREKVLTLEQEIAAVREELGRREAAIRQLTTENSEAIQAIRTSAETEAAHLRDDHEILRTRVLRRLKADVELLELGLEALRRPEPKVHVMLDSAERVADALRKEIKNLQGSD